MGLQGIRHVLCSSQDFRGFDPSRHQNFRIHRRGKTLDPDFQKSFAYLRKGTPVYSSLVPYSEYEFIISYQVDIDVGPRLNHMFFNKPSLHRTSTGILGAI